MHSSGQQSRLAALRAVIADIERKPALLERRAGFEPEADGGFPALGGGLVQEVFTDAARNGGASLAFALGQGRALLTARRPALLYLQLIGDEQFFGLPYGPGLWGFGFDPARLVMVRAQDMAELLWATEEALACTAAAAIVTDIGGAPGPLDFTASRRLGLRAAESGTSLFLLRYGRARAPSAAHLRWHLSPWASGSGAFDRRAPGAWRWQVRLERGARIKHRGEWLLEWTENGFATLPVRSGQPQRRRDGAALSGAVPAALADRLSQTA